MREQKGFTLIELMVVAALLSILAGAASVALQALPKPVEKDAQRLAAVLDAQRAKSRSTGQPIFFKSQGNSYRVHRGSAVTSERLSAGTTLAPADIKLGPEPVIEPQRVVLTDASGNAHAVITDGVRPFYVESVQ